MKKLFLLLLPFMVLFISVNTSAQINLQNIYDQIKPPARQTTFIAAQKNPDAIDRTHMAQILAYMEKCKSMQAPLKNKLGMYKTYPDTIIVGAAPYDSLVITGTFTHKGPIIVALNGVLIFKNANVTNVGDLIAFNHGKIFIDSSTVSFPQDYFYQRSLTLVNHATAIIANSTLKYGGYTHSCVVTDSAQLNLFNVTQPDFMTTGMSAYANININGTNQAGEFIMEDHIKLNIKNAHTALLWHHFPDTAVVKWTFGTSDTVYGYQFNKSKSGIKGVDYQVNADSVYNIMWGMMPSAGSKINISNSKIRAIGLWFDHKQDTTNVSGISNNSMYSSYSLPLSDRSLVFSNCYVQTWSLYVFKQTHVNISGCITGEVGSFNKSTIVGSSFWNDGSGGYLFTSDSSVGFCVNTTATTAVRSEKSSIFVFGYSTIGSYGYAAALDKSFLVVVQSTLPADPAVYSSAAVLYDYLNPPANAYVDTVVAFNGSAWIHRGPTSAWMHFKSKQLFYQKPGDTTMIAIAPADTLAVSNGFIANWNTHGLAAGNYNITLRIRDDWGNKTDASRQVNLLSGILTGISETSIPNKLSIFPNPAQDEFTLLFSTAKNERAKIQLLDMQGRILITETRELISGNNAIRINTSHLPAGNYLCRVETDDGVWREKVVVGR